jgi:hypothetical protein
MAILIVTLGAQDMRTRADRPPSSPVPAESEFKVETPSGREVIGCRPWSESILGLVRAAHVTTGQLAG